MSWYSLAESGCLFWPDCRQLGCYCNSFYPSLESNALSSHMCGRCPQFRATASRSSALWFLCNVSCLFVNSFHIVPCNIITNHNWIR